MALIIALVRLILSLVFSVAGITKLIDQKGTREAVLNFGAPKPVAPSVAVVLPLVELAIAVGLLFSSTAWLSALGAVLVLGLFIVAISINLAQGKTHDCHCFGQIYSRPLGWPTLARNVLFALAAVVVIWNGPQAQTPLASALRDLHTWQLVLLGAAVAVAAVFLFKRRESTPTDHAHEQPASLPIGSAAPDFELPAYEGGRTSLSQLLALGKPVLLIFTNPKCGPCISLFKEIRDWQTEHNDRMTIALLTFGTIKDNFVNVARNGLGQVLLQQKNEVSKLYGANVTPTAVIVDPAGVVVSNVAAGGDEIRELLNSHVQSTPTAVESATINTSHEPGIHPTAALQ